jgi:PIN domain nuclease of toxin-antitoxin system
MRAFLDTHAAVFLYEGRVDLFGAASRNLLERAALHVSPLVRLELGFLREMGKLTIEPDLLLGALAADCGLTATGDALEALVPFAMPLTWTRDPFDRLLVATALLHRAPLITRDARIQENFGAAVW